MYDWSTRLSDLGEPGIQLRREFERPKYEIYSELRNMRVSTPTFLSMPLEEFMKDPGGHLRELNCDVFYMIIEERGQPGGSPAAASGTLSAAQVTTAARALAQGNRSLMITVIEEAEILLDGNIIVSDSGALEGEFVKWNGVHFSRSHCPPEILVSRNVFTRRLLYSCEDESCRRLIHKAVKAVPVTDSCESASLLPGYYEIQIIRSQKSSTPVAVVHDYRRYPAFWKVAETGVQ